MPPISINANPFVPSIQQKRDMHFYLKMLLHANGSLPNIPRLQKFWDLSITEKVKTLQREINETRFAPESLFWTLDCFYGKLIESIKHYIPNNFEKNLLLKKWRTTLGKTFNEFRISELNRWKSYEFHY